VRAGHLNDRLEFFMLLDGELEAFLDDPASLKEELAQRLTQWRELFELDPPFIVANGTFPPLPEWPRRSQRPAAGPSARGDILHGVTGSAGTAVGRARVVMDASDPCALEPGDVLVAPLTDPAWTPLFTVASAVVVEVGGQVSHAVIVSRELGLPCVISVEDATRRIPDGAIVAVDGSAGTVTIHDLADPPERMNA
jgi:pyruvate,water dikinase